MLNISNNKILIIDDEIDICEQMSGLLNDRGFETKYSISSKEGLDFLKELDFSLVILDIWLNNSKLDGFQTLEKIKNFNEAIPVLMISGHGNIETAVNSIKKGAYDFIEKPIDGDLLIFKVKKALENYDLKNKINNFPFTKDSKLIAKSFASKNVLNSIKKISKTDSAVLLSGKNGSGREFLARKIHLDSNRKNKQFKVIDFSLRDFSKLENEIFGFEHDKVTNFIGSLEEAVGGTLFLKNIDKMNKKMQGKFLRVFEEKKFYRVGGASSIKTDFRIISSSNYSINQLKTKLFNKDLINKINFYEILVPSIENRKDDINDLVIEFLKESLSIYDLDIDNISNDAIIFFSNLDSVKSVSQLKKFIQWSVFMFSESNKIKISKDDIIKLLNSFLSNSNNNLNSDFLNLDLKNAREFFEKKYLNYNLVRFNNNITKMSENIGMERTALYRKLKTLKIKSNN